MLWVMLYPEYCRRLSCATVRLLYLITIYTIIYELYAAIP